MIHQMAPGGTVGGAQKRFNQAKRVEIRSETQFFDYISTLLHKNDSVRISTPLASAHGDAGVPRTAVLKMSRKDDTKIACRQMKASNQPKGA
ncbi:MAG: hypothetical protein Q4D19_03965 [Lautropia sp.]|nr:hypothetical protein [Lautropia sp.]